MSLIALAIVVALAVITAAVLILLARTRARERRLRALLREVPATTVVMLDRDLKIEAVLGAEAPPEGDAEIVGEPLERVLPAEAAAQLSREYQAVLDGDKRAFDFVSPGSGATLSVHAGPRYERGELVGVVAITQDVSEQRRAEHDRSTEAHRRYLILDAMNEAYVATDGSGVVTGWNRAAAETFGWSAREAIGRNVMDLIIPESDHRDLLAMLERRLPDSPASGRHDIRAERGALHRDGREFTVELNATLVEVDGETMLLSLMHDITRRKRAEADLRQHASDVEAIAEAVGELARSTVASDARRSICRAAARIAGADAGILFEPDASGTGLRVTAAEGADVLGEVVQFTERSGAVAAFSSREQLFASEHSDHPSVSQSVLQGTQAGSALWIPIEHDREAVGVIAVAWWERIESLPDRVERVMGVISAEASVAIERARLLERLERMARTDELTGLTNRRAWDDELSRELLRAGRDRAPLAVAMLDLDRFKDYNDMHGHQAGDRLLKEAAGAWKQVLRETDLLARYGGEEFSVALPGCNREQGEQLVERLRSLTPGAESCSAGLAFWDGVESAETLVGRADAALYRAKEAGRDQTVRAEPA